MSTGLGARAQNNDPDYAFFDIRRLAYNSSKTALNAITVQVAHELKETPINGGLFNEADPPPC